MKSNFKRIGDYIKLVDERNRNLEVTELLGINLSKSFMPSVANITGIDFSKYKIVRNGRFACNIMHVGRDEKLPIGLYSKQTPSIISPAYITFEVIDKQKLLPEFLMMVFQGSEFDRFTWFVSDSSVRGGLEWERFCEIEIPIPEDINDQKKFVAIYNGLNINQKCYEKTLNDLQFVCNHSIDSLKSGSTDSIGTLVRLVDFRNIDGKLNRVLGINVKKEFMRSVANTSDTDLRNYKIIDKKQFAYSAMQVGRDETVRVALYNQEKPAIISPAYLVFEVLDEKKILPEFLMMWFHRPESDRYGWFISDGSVRSSLEWERFSEIKIPVPKIEIQKMMIKMYMVFERRKSINEKLKKMVKPLCPILIKGVVENLSSESVN